MIRNQEVFPVYPPDFQIGIKIVPSIIFSKKRSFQLDAINWSKRLNPPLMIQGKENIPLKGPLLLIINHYYRPKFKAWWSVLAASAQLPVEIHWIMTGAWTFPGNPSHTYLETISRTVFKRIADVYDFFTMPPMPPRAWETEARASSVRRILHFVKKNADAVIGLSPEGGDSPTGTLEMPAPGVGRFILHLARSGLAVQPLGIYEEGGVLNLNFGKRIDLNWTAEFSTEELDRWSSQAVMQAIADLLPRHLRGAFLR